MGQIRGRLPMAGQAMRWLLAAAGAAAGFYLGLTWLGRLALTYPLPLQASQATGLVLASVLVGGVFGHRVGPTLVVAVVSWVRAIEQRLSQAPGLDILAGTLGGILGLLVSYLLTPALVHIAWPIRALVALLLAYLGAAVFIRKHEDWLGLWSGRSAGGPPGDAPAGEGATVSLRDGRPKIMDTSAIIDGRVADLYDTGFLEGELIVPSFVLDELRHMADSSDELRRQRGRFGLEVLGNLQRTLQAPVVFESQDPDPEAEVDSKLVLLARQMGGHVVTTDFNLNKVAELQGVSVLNVNALAYALKPRVLAGEAMVVRIVQPGKQPGQGIGYLEDGTMVLVEGGRRFMNQDIEIVVTNWIQKPQGRMVFGKPRAEVPAT